MEQIHEEISKIFRDAEVDRMDVDSMRRKFAYEKLYEKLEEASAKLIGEDKARSLASMQRSAQRYGNGIRGAGYGGHFRAVQGFRYLGEPSCE